VLGNDLDLWLGSLCTDSHVSLFSLVWKFMII